MKSQENVVEKGLVVEKELGDHKIKDQFPFSLIKKINWESNA